MLLLLLAASAVLGSLLSPVLYVLLVQPATIYAADSASGYTLCIQPWELFITTPVYLPYTLSFYCYGRGFCWALRAAKKAGQEKELRSIQQVIIQAMGKDGEVGFEAHASSGNTHHGQLLSVQYLW